jgi:hypothetical protein
MSIKAKNILRGRGKTRNKAELTSKLAVVFSG